MHDQSNLKHTFLPFTMAIVALVQMAAIANGQSTGHEYLSTNGLLRLKGETTTAVFSTSGGGFIDFRTTRRPDINPLNWDSEVNASELKSRPRGHFLCLDRWGAPSNAEQSSGMPFHGEAAHVRWNVVKVDSNGDSVQAKMACELPIAGLAAERSIHFPINSSVCVVTETVNNTGRLGRIYNMVQHPSIAPPFLDDTTIVDSNATFGFSQADPLPEHSSNASRWPMMKFAGEETNLRHFQSGGKDGSDVSSFVFADDTKIAWVTACNPTSGLMLGYLWRTSDFPWLNIWRYRQQGKVVARGLEFGTTGYHQPYATLVKQHQILGRKLFEYIDVGQTQERSYVAFVAEIPVGYAGVKSIEHQDGLIQITESQSDKPQIIKLKLDDDVARLR
jgi:hypothetical protein